MAETPPSAKPSEREQNPEPSKAVDHVAGAQRLLAALQQKVGHHPELAQAITELEMALSILTVQTAGLL